MPFSSVLLSVWSIHLTLPTDTYLYLTWKTRNLMVSSVAMTTCSVSKTSPAYSISRPLAVLAGHTHQMKKSENHAIVNRAKYSFTWNNTLSPIFKSLVIPTRNCLMAFPNWPFHVEPWKVNIYALFVEKHLADMTSELSILQETSLKVWHFSWQFQLVTSMPWTKLKGVTQLGLQFLLKMAL